MDKSSSQWRSALSGARLRTQAWWDTWGPKIYEAAYGTPPSGEPQPARNPKPEATAEQEPDSELEAPSMAPGSALYQHTAHAHRPRNVNRMHRKEQEEAGLNTRIAVWLTKNVGTMQCAYLFAGIGIGSLVGVATNNVVLAAIFGSLSSYFLQLVLLPILSVGQNVLGRHAELQSDEMFKTTQHSFHDIEEIMAHLSAQDNELLKQTNLLLHLSGAPASAVGVGAADVPAAPATPAPAAKATPAAPPTGATPATRARKGKPAVS